MMTPVKQQGHKHLDAADLSRAVSHVRAERLAAKRLIRI
jgi:hypothetical protein